MLEGLKILDLGFQWFQTLFLDLFRYQCVEQSYEKAFEYYEQAAHLGFAKAQYNLGIMYAKGQGVEQSYETAAALYAQAVQQGYTFAMYNLGLLYANGQGVEQSYEKAAQLYEQAAQQGHPSAMFNLGILYVKGQGELKETFAKRENYLPKQKHQGTRRPSLH